jgi:Xaa-Pro aminopeptidase
VKPGVQASSVDKAARDVIEAAGFGSTFRHGVGHGIGLSVHEPPYLTASSAMTLQEDMTFTLEPGIYFVGRFGIRLEQVVAVTSNGARVLSGASLETVRLPT